jgi:hypothetical protein
VNKKEKYGFTAEQIANKIEKDSSAMSVVTHLLKETNENERFRLVMDVLPTRYFANLESELEQPFVTDLPKCFRKVFESLSVENKRKLMKKFVRVLKEENSQTVMAYESAFFRGSDLEYLDKDEAQLVKDHLFSRLEKEVEMSLLETLTGIGQFLKGADEIVTITDVLVKATVNSKNSDVLKRRSRIVLEGLFWEIPVGPDEAMKERIDDWVTLYKETNVQPHLGILQAIRASFVPAPEPEAESGTPKGASA